MMLAGPSGSGKTRSGLIIATELAEGGRILGIDTEQQSMLTYADDFTFEHLAWEPPFHPRELTQLIAEAGSTYAVILVDSLSHFWRGEGGTLDIASGKFTGWKEARPAQESLVDGIIRSGAHVIVTARSKVEYAQELENGKHVVKKLGMSAQQDDNLEFEMNVAAELSMDHTATISKSRTTVLPVGRAFGINRTAEMARIYLEWLKGGEPPASKEDLDSLKASINKLEPVELRKVCKEAFVAEFGNPDFLLASKLEAARALVADFAKEPEGFVDSNGRVHVPEAS
jgi:hypothetical protein